MSFLSHNAWPPAATGPRVSTIARALGISKILSLRLSRGFVLFSLHPAQHGFCEQRDVWQAGGESSLASEPPGLLGVRHQAAGTFHGHHTGVLCRAGHSGSTRHSSEQVHGTELPGSQQFSSHSPPSPVFSLPPPQLYAGHSLGW